MSQLRFATARSVLEAFPELTSKLTIGPGDEPPIEYLGKLCAEERVADAVAFCAHLLPRREAVWWACCSLKDLLDDAASNRSEAFHAAESWVYEPSEDNRRKALEIGTKGESSDPLTWLALGAGWSGGMLSANPAAPVAMPQYLTARAARIAITLGASRMAPSERLSRLRACVAEGMKLAQTGL